MMVGRKWEMNMMAQRQAALVLQQVLQQGRSARQRATPREHMTSMRMGSGSMMMQAEQQKWTWTGV